MRANHSAQFLWGVAMLEVYHWVWSAEARAAANAGRWTEEHFHLDFSLRLPQDAKMHRILSDLDSAKAMGLELQAVARVHTNDPSVAFERTNSIETVWTKNSGLTCLVLSARSTSCGDLIRRPMASAGGASSSGAGGEWSYVAAVGFRPLPAEIGRALDARFGFGPAEPGDAAHDAAAHQAQRPLAA